MTEGNSEPTESKPPNEMQKIDTADYIHKQAQIPHFQKIRPWGFLKNVYNIRLSNTFIHLFTLTYNLTTWHILAHNISKDVRESCKHVPSAANAPNSKTQPT